MITEAQALNVGVTAGQLASRGEAEEADAEEVNASVASLTGSSVRASIFRLGLGLYFSWAW